MELSGRISEEASQKGAPFVGERRVWIEGVPPGEQGRPGSVGARCRRRDVDGNRKAGMFQIDHPWTFLTQ